MDTAKKTALGVASKGRVSLRAIKQLIDDGLDMPLRKALNLEGGDLQHLLHFAGPKRRHDRLCGKTQTRPQRTPGRVYTRTNKTHQYTTV